MKKSTLIFYVAGVVAGIALFIGVVDLMKNKSKPRMILTTAAPVAPVIMATAPPVVYSTAAPRMVATTMAPRMVATTMGPQVRLVSMPPDDRFVDDIEDDPLADME